MKTFVPLFTFPNPQLLVNIYKSMIVCPINPEMIIPNINIFTNFIKLLKLTLLPYKTIVYSSKPSESALSLLYLMCSIPGVMIETRNESNKALGFPLIIDTNTIPIIPYLPMQLIEKLIGNKFVKDAFELEKLEEFLNDKKVIIRVKALDEKANKEAASSLYELISEEKINQ